MRVYDIYRFPTGAKRKPAELFGCIRQHLAAQQLTYSELLLLVSPSLWGRPADKYLHQFLPALKDVPALAVGQHSVFTNTDAQLRPLRKMLKPLGFTSTGYAHNTMFFRRINARRHGVCLAVDVSPISRILRPTISLRGLGFSFSWDIKESIPLNQQDADAFCQRFADFFAGDFAKALEVLSASFPPSPEWFFTPSDVDC